MCQSGAETGMRLPAMMGFGFTVLQIAIKADTFSALPMIRPGKYSRRRNRIELSGAIHFVASSIELGKPRPSPVSFWNRRRFHTELFLILYILYVLPFHN